MYAIRSYYEDALDIGRQIAEGLAAAHGDGIVHRDIKPANILVSPEGRATIMDFGLARLTEASKLTRADQTVGTAAYMLPFGLFQLVFGPLADRYGKKQVITLAMILFTVATGLCALGTGFVINSYSIHYTKLYDLAWSPCRKL